MKKISIFLLILCCGIYLGLQLPRGAGLLFAVTGIEVSPTDRYSKLQSHQALFGFEEALGAARKMVLEDARTEQEAAEGMRWVLRAAAMASEIAGDANPKQPYFQRMDTPTRKIGGDNPDAEYALAAIDGRYAYRITGNIGNVSYLGFTINGGNGMSKRRQVGYISDTMLTLDQEGNFTILLSTEKPKETGDWVKITEDASSILVRQYIADRHTAILPTLNIEIMGGNPAFLPPTDDEIATAITNATFAFFALTNLHNLVLPELIDEPNKFIRATSENLGGEISGADNLYMIGSHQIANDEALVVTVFPPKTRYWNFSLETRWHETPDYLHRPTSRTLSEVEYGEDGSVRFIISHIDIGLRNWMDTSGHNFGFMTFRWLDGIGGKVLMPEVKLVKLAELAAVDSRNANQ